MRERWAGWSYLELPLVLLASPWLLFPEGSYGLGMAVVPILWAARRVTTGRFVVPTPLDVPIALLLAMTGIGQALSADPTFSLSKCAGVVLGVGTYYAVGGWTGSRRAWVLALLLFAGINAGVAVISLFATAWGAKFPLFEPLLARLPRLIDSLPGSPPEGFNPNSVAGLFLFGLPLLFLLAVAPRGLFAPLGRWAAPARIGVAAVTALVALLFAATQSRAGYLSLALALALLPLLPRPRGLAAAAGAALVAASLLWFSPYRATTMAQFTGTAGALSSFAGRIQVWERAGAVIRDFPFTGVGLGMFRFVQPRLYPIYTVPPQTDVGHAHNQFLQAGVDVGVPGLAAYFALWIGAAALGVNVLWRGQSPYRVVMLGLMAGWAGHFLWAMVETHALGSKAGWLWWWALALVAGTALRTRSEGVG